MQSKTLAGEPKRGGFLDSPGKPHAPAPGTSHGEPSRGGFLEDSRGTLGEPSRTLEANAQTAASDIKSCFAHRHKRTHKF